MGARARSTAILVAAGLTLSTVGSAHANMDSGIKGQIAINKPCRDSPNGQSELLAAPLGSPPEMQSAGCVPAYFERGVLFRIQNVNSRRVERFRTRREGRFRVELAPGRYTVGPRCGGPKIRVKPGRVQRASLTCRRRNRASPPLTP